MLGHDVTNQKGCFVFLRGAVPIVTGASMPPSVASTVKTRTCVSGILHTIDGSGVL